MLPQDFVIAIPRQPSPACAAAQPLLPYPTDAPIELLETAVVRRIGRNPLSYPQVWKVFQRAAHSAGLDGFGTHTLRHSYRSWLDETGAPLTVQKELMRHASIQTTMNIYGKAMTDSKRQAHSKVVEMVLNSSKSGKTADHKKPVAAIGS